MDGILIDSENLWQQGERAMFAEFGIDLTDRMLAQTRGLRTEEMVHYWTSQFRIESESRESLMQRYDQRMVELMKTSVPLMEGAREAVQFFREKKLPVALASCSTMEHIEAAMIRHGMMDDFDLLVSAANGMPGKPHPEVYLHTAKGLEIPPEFCLAIEDTFYGLISARAAKMKVVAMPDPHEYDQPRFFAADRKIRSLTEIDEELFEEIQNI
jgi:sugar-phosphatase